MQLIETVEVGSGGAASIEFTSIPQDGLVLLCVYSIRHDGSENEALNLTFNNSTNYNYVFLTGDGSSASSLAGTGATNGFAGYVNWSGSTTNTFGNAQVLVPNYAGSNTKSYSVDAVSENNATNARAGIQANSWNNTSAITSLKLFRTSRTLQQYSTASLYIIS